MTHDTRATDVVATENYAVTPATRNHRWSAGFSAGTTAALISAMKFLA